MSGRRYISAAAGTALVVLEVDHAYYGRRWLACEGDPELLFTENETNTSASSGSENGRAT